MRVPKIVGMRRSARAARGFEEPGEALRPFLGALARCDQILPDLDQRIGEAPDGGVPVDGVAGERPIIGLVVADDESVLGLQPVQQRLGEAVVRIPQDAHMPGPGPAAPDRREAVDRHDDRRMAGRHGPVDRIRDGIVVGIVEPGDAPLHLRLVRPRHCPARRRRRRGA